jgi:hypothetical protein
MVRIILAIFLVLHGLIHLLGFITGWKLAKIEDIPHRTTMLAGKVNIGEVGARILGVLWLLAAIGYIVAGIGLFILAPWWLGATIIVTWFSLVLCLLGFPDAQFGLYINVILLVFLYFGGKLGWLP